MWLRYQRCIPGCQDDRKKVITLTFSLTLFLVVLNRAESIRQNFFGIYIDEMSSILRAAHLGCNMYGIFLAMILFADDLCLLAPTRSALAKMIQLSADYCNKFGLTFNTSKSKIVVFSKSIVKKENLCPTYLNGEKMDYVDSIKYLGTTIESSKGIKFSATKDLSSFYRASNSILRAVKKPNELIQLHLLYANCIPILTYASAVKEYSSRQMQECNTAVNDALRLIFGYNRWESVRDLRNSLGYKSLTELFHVAKRKFDMSLLSHRNSVIRHIAFNILIETESE